MTVVTTTALSRQHRDQALVVGGGRGEHPVERGPINLSRRHIGRHRPLKGPEAHHGVGRKGSEQFVELPVGELGTTATVGTPCRGDLVRVQPHEPIRLPVQRQMSARRAHDPRGSGSGGRAHRRARGLVAQNEEKSDAEHDDPQEFALGPSRRSWTHPDRDRQTVRAP